MAKLLFIGQAPPKMVVERPFGRTHLYAWLASAGISEEAALRDFAFTALVSEFPGSSKHGHKAPTAAHIAAEQPRIRELIRTLQPRALVPVGTLSIRQLLGEQFHGLDEAIGRVYTVDVLKNGKPLPIIPLPHPSGASPWIYLDGHSELLSQALLLIKQYF